ncbi:hypothetical protein [Larkinella soli]|uniref:hypothetical protein n=1 Tax=Larkinella soli TaxID=1770527 RepID=UPI000FFBDEAA|nr:hypothetical protein [Larkinella soli]
MNMNVLISSFPYITLGLGLTLFLTWLYSSFQGRIARFVAPVIQFLARHIFVTHLVGLIILSMISLSVVIALKPWVLATDPSARPYDETLLQKVPLTLACLMILCPVALLIIRITMPGQYDYLNFSNKDLGPDHDFKQLTPCQRLLIALGFYCFILFLGVQLFTGSL